FSLCIRLPPTSTLFPYTTLFRSVHYSYFLILFKLYKSIVYSFFKMPSLGVEILYIRDVVFFKLDVYSIIYTLATRNPWKSKGTAVTSALGRIDCIGRAILFPDP